jgi:hypothetical protein
VATMLGPQSGDPPWLYLPVQTILPILAPDRIQSVRCFDGELEGRNVVMRSLQAGAERLYTAIGGDGQLNTANKP